MIPFEMRQRPLLFALAAHTLLNGAPFLSLQRVPSYNFMQLLPNTPSTKRSQQGIVGKLVRCSFDCNLSLSLLLPLATSTSCQSPSQSPSLRSATIQRKSNRRRVAQRSGGERQRQREREREEEEEASCLLLLLKQSVGKVEV